MICFNWQRIQIWRENYFLVGGGGGWGEGMPGGGGWEGKYQARDTYVRYKVKTAAKEWEGPRVVDSLEN